MPSFILIRHAQSDRPGSFLEQRVLFYEIDYIELGPFGLLCSEGEEEPLVVASSVGVILQNEVVFLYFTLFARKCSKKIAAFKPRIEPTVVIELRFQGSLIVFGVVVGGLVE